MLLTHSQLHGRPMGVGQTVSEGSPHKGSGRRMPHPPAACSPHPLTVHTAFCNGMVVWTRDRGYIPCLEVQARQKRELDRSLEICTLSAFVEVVKNPVLLCRRAYLPLTFISSPPPEAHAGHVHPRHSVMGFLASPLYTVPITTFVENNCIVFVSCVDCTVATVDPLPPLLDS